MKQERKLKGLRITLFFVFFAVFLFSGYKVFIITRENRAAKNSYSELMALMETIAPEPSVPEKKVRKSTAASSETSAAEQETTRTEETETTETQTEEQPPQLVSVNFASLQKVNPEIKAWIRCPNANIDYPVAHTGNNSYYLSHLYNHEENGSGTIFIDYRNKGDFSERNTVIYGHHRKNRTMFNGLEEYKHQAFFDANPTMTLFTPGGDYTVELICGTIESGDKEFVRFDIKSDEELKSYVDGFRSRSTFNSPVKLQPGDRIVSLCTCSYEWSNARYMLIGRLSPVYS